MEIGSTDHALNRDAILLRDSFVIQYIKDGEEIGIDEIADDSQKQALRAMWDTIAKQIGPERCPKHRAAATVVCEGRHALLLKFSVQGCCREFTKSIAAQLNELFTLVPDGTAIQEIQEAPVEPACLPELDEAVLDQLAETGNPDYEVRSREFGKEKPSKLHLLYYERDI